MVTHNHSRTWTICVRAATSNYVKVVAPADSGPLQSTHQLGVRRSGLSPLGIFVTNRIGDGIAFISFVRHTITAHPETARYYLL